MPNHNIRPNSISSPHQAKNLPPDPQTLLQQPVWTTAIQFLSWNSAPSNLVATGTAYKQVQIYDVRESPSAARRPALYTPEGLLSHRVTALCQLRDGATLAAGDAAGDVHLLDVRKMHSGKQFRGRKSKSAREEIGTGRLVGPGGSVRQLVAHPSLPYVAAVGLDRKLWTWDSETRRMTDCVYLRQRLNCALFCDDGSWSDGGADGSDDEEGGGEGGAGYYDDGDEMEDEDEVEDYVDSDEDGGGDDGAARGADRVPNTRDVEDVESSGGSGSGSSGGTTESESGEEEEEDDDESASDDDDDGSSGSEEEEEEAREMAAANPKKRQKK